MQQNDNYVSLLKVIYVITIGQHSLVLQNGCRGLICYLVVLSTSTVHLDTIPAITPNAASQGAKKTRAAAPAAPHVTGIESKTLPLLSFTTILFTFESFKISLTFPIKFFPET